MDLTKWYLKMYNQEKIKKIFYKALNGVKSENIVKNNISVDKTTLHIAGQSVALDSFNDLYIFSVGKAGFDMAEQCEKILKEKIKGGVAISLKETRLKYIQTVTSTHPVVSEKSLSAAQILTEEIKKVKPNDMFIFFLSGGASAMIEQPVSGLSFKEFRTITSAVLKSGVDIKALNKVRKLLSDIKGGKLANRFATQKGYVLVLSDVVGDDLNTIGSAPMNNGKYPHIIIGNNKIALNEAKEYIQNDVQKTKILTTTLDMSSKKAARFIKDTIKRYNKKYDSYCILLGGETTTKVKGSGIGGRNQELALRLVIEKCIKKDMTILCAGSDGIDGNSPATGAFVDIDIYKLIKENKVDPEQYLKNSDSYSFFKKTGYEFTTGVTGTNVMDFIIILKNKRKDK